MGLTGLIALDGFKSSIDKTIGSKSKILLGADFGMSARRPLLEKEIQAVFEAIDKSTVPKRLGETSIETKMIELFSMVSADSERSRLVQIRAVENNYPFYGEIEVTGLKMKKPVLSDMNVWIHPELISQLNVAVGETLKIGSADFKVQGIVENDSASGFSSSVAPRVYINLKALKKTDLIRAGSIAWHSSLFKIAQASEKQLDQIRENVFEQIDSPEVKVFTHQKASEQLAGLVSRLNDFLGLTSLVALFLAAIGSFFLLRSYFALKTDQVAILMSLGLSPLKAFMFYLSQIVCLGFMSAVLAGLVSLLIVPVLGGLVEGLLPFEVNFFIEPGTFLMGAVVGILGSVFICLPLLVKFTKTKPARLLTKQNGESLSKTDLLKTFALSLPALALFIFLSVELSNSYRVGILFTLTFAAVIILLTGFSILIFRDFSFGGADSIGLGLKWAVRDLNRNKSITSISFVSIGIGVLLLNLIPQIQKTIESDLMAPDRSNLPTFFMFDIQEEQVDSLKSIVKAQGADLKNLSPAVRARLMSVNGEGFSKSLDVKSGSKLSREQEREERFRNRGFNLSYRAELDESETILEGPAFTGVYDDDSGKEPEISIETRFASRLGLEIGDVLEFEIDGVPIKGKIINTRSVKWSSFQPNFFIQFQPGALDLAPKTFVASVKADGMDSKLKLQNTIVESIPNISMVDVTRVMKRLLAIMTQMGWALKFMSFLCVLVGFVVIYSVASHQSSQRKWDVGLLKSLGAPFSVIRNQFLWQFFLISLGACVFGISLSFAASYFISVYIFETSWKIYALVPFISLVGTLVITVLVTYFAVRKTLSTKTVDLFL
jgi:putative ABC transport system permease protein